MVGRKTVAPTVLAAEAEKCGGSFMDNRCDFIDRYIYALVDPRENIKIAYEVAETLKFMGSGYKVLLVRVDKLNSLLMVKYGASIFSR